MRPSMMALVSMTIFPLTPPFEAWVAGASPFVSSDGSLSSAPRSSLRVTATCTATETITNAAPNGAHSPAAPGSSDSGAEARAAAIRPTYQAQDADHQPSK